MTNAHPRVVAIQREALRWIAVAPMMSPWRVRSNAKARPAADVLRIHFVISRRSASYQWWSRIEPYHIIMCVNEGTSFAAQQSCTRPYHGTRGCPSRQHWLIGTSTLLKPGRILQALLSLQRRTIQETKWQAMSTKSLSCILRQKRRVAHLQQRPKGRFSDVIGRTLRHCRKV